MKINEKEKKIKENQGDSAPGGTVTRSWHLAGSYEFTHAHQVREEGLLSALR